MILTDPSEPIFTQFIGPIQWLTFNLIQRMILIFTTINLWEVFFYYIMGLPWKACWISLLQSVSHFATIWWYLLSCKLEGLWWWCWSCSFRSISLSTFLQKEVATERASYVKVWSFSSHLIISSSARKRLWWEGHPVSLLIWLIWKGIQLHCWWWWPNILLNSIQQFKLSRCISRHDICVNM